MLIHSFQRAIVKFLALWKRNRCNKRPKSVKYDGLPLTFWCWGITLLLPGSNHYSRSVPMVDFKKRLLRNKVETVIDPVKLYETLDRQHDKGPLRPAQAAVLEEWFTSRCHVKDVIVKLHTGQGKTLIGLLMLQLRLNQKKGPGLNFCSDKFLIEQTCDQASQFGIATCTADPDLPEEFLVAKPFLLLRSKNCLMGFPNWNSIAVRSQSAPFLWMTHTLARIGSVILVGFGFPKMTQRPTH